MRYYFVISSMVLSYNFLASWQLFPEKCVYQNGIVPKSGTFKIASLAGENVINILHNWVSVSNEAFCTQYQILPDGNIHSFENKELAESYIASIPATTLFCIDFLNTTGVTILKIRKEILPNGYLKITQTTTAGLEEKTNVDVYHKQMNVLPYSSSVSGVAIKPTNEGMIKHKALTAMEEQTNMQLNQIRQQIELLAMQARELSKRKELSLLIYESKLNFKPQIGHTYHLYENKDSTHLLSLIGPKEWGVSLPFKNYVSSVKLLADHTWLEV